MIYVVDIYYRYTHLAIPLARSVERILVDAGVHMSSSAPLLVPVQGEGDGAGQSFAVTGTRRRVKIILSYHFHNITFRFCCGNLSKACVNTDTHLSSIELSIIQHSCEYQGNAKLIYLENFNLAMVTMLIKFLKNPMNVVIWWLMCIFIKLKLLSTRYNIIVNLFVKYCAVI